MRGMNIVLLPPSARSHKEEARAQKEMEATARREDELRTQLVAERKQQAQQRLQVKQMVDKWAEEDAAARKAARAAEIEERGKARREERERIRLHIAGELF